MQKPARYIGCEDGAQVAGARRRTRWPGSSCTPTPTRSGLPNQGLQILYEILNERDDAVAERSYAPWVRHGGALRQPRRAAVPRRHPPAGAGDFDLLAFNLSAELVYTNVLNCIDLAGVPVRAAERGPEHPLVVAGGHCTFNPEPLADFVDLFVIGDGEEVVSEITEVVGEWKRSGRTPGSREHVLRALSHVAGVYVPSMYDVEYDGDRARGVTPRYADVPERRREAHHRRPGRVAVPQVAARAAHRGRARPAQRRDLPRLHARLPVLPGGHDHPPGARAPRRPGAHAWCSDGLRRTGYDEVSLTSLSSADYSGIDEVVGGIINDPM